MSVDSRQPTVDSPESTVVAVHGAEWTLRLVLSAAHSIDLPDRGLRNRRPSTADRRLGPKQC
jgi:hypothetical protein